ncbi:MAG: hypothetical protein QOG10_4823 [Kribbellaceae bacterium]|jgi:hypothetical protein|nr:hypothetical protein [Kribbellaceae bacterium]
MPENEPEQELGPKISEALRTKAGAARSPRGETMAREARRRIRKRRQTLVAGAAAVVVAVAIGGVWSAVGGQSPVATSSKQGTASGQAHDSTKNGPQATGSQTACPLQHPISTAGNVTVGPVGIGLDLRTPVTGLQACRYRLLVPGETGNTLIGSASFNASRAQDVATAIAGLPERNPALPRMMCIPEAARGREAIVLRFGTAAGTREVWVSYDGCLGEGFFTQGHTYGLYAGPLKLFMTGSVRPTGGTYLDHLKGW